MLLAEDNAVNQQIAGEILESENVLLTIADNGEEAVRRLTESPPGAFDLVLMDLQMPVMDGFAATRAIRDYEAENGLPPVPIIGITARAFPEDEAACLNAGCSAYLSKPVRRTALLATLARLLGESGLAARPDPAVPPVEDPAASPAPDVAADSA